MEARLDPRERRITALFRRWPGLDSSEQSELKRLWDDRIRRAKRARRSPVCRSTDRQVTRNVPRI